MNVSRLHGHEACLRDTSQRDSTALRGVVQPSLALAQPSPEEMDACGNDAPLLWMLHQRGYDLHSIRKRETETEKQLREAREALDAERTKVRVLTEALHGRVA